MRSKAKPHKAPSGKSPSRQAATALQRESPPRPEQRREAPSPSPRVAPNSPRPLDPAEESQERQAFSRASGPKSPESPERRSQAALSARPPDPVERPAFSRAPSPSRERESPTRRQQAESPSSGQGPPCPGEVGESQRRAPASPGLSHGLRPVAGFISRGVTLSKSWERCGGKLQLGIPVMTAIIHRSLALLHSDRDSHLEFKLVTVEGKLLAPKNVLYKCKTRPIPGFLTFDSGMKRRVIKIFKDYCIRVPDRVHFIPRFDVQNLRVISRGNGKTPPLLEMVIQFHELPPAGNSWDNPMVSFPVDCVPGKTLKVIEKDEVLLRKLQQLLRDGCKLQITRPDGTLAISPSFFEEGDDEDEDEDYLGDESDESDDEEDDGEGDELGDGEMNPEGPEENPEAPEENGGQEVHEGNRRCQDLTRARTLQDDGEGDELGDGEANPEGLEENPEAPEENGGHGGQEVHEGNGVRQHSTRARTLQQIRRQPWRAVRAQMREADDGSRGSGRAAVRVRPQRLRGDSSAPSSQALNARQLQAGCVVNYSPQASSASDEASFSCSTAPGDPSASGGVILSAVNVG